MRNRSKLYYRQAKKEKLKLEGLGIGMCGPLDYDKGISLMKGVDKYEALYGMNLKKELRKRLALKNSFDIFLEPDSWAFARGEAWLGAGKGYHRILAVTLGTGFGSAFVIDGELLSDGSGVPPPYGWIGSLPFRDSKLDDYISKRGILRLYKMIGKKTNLENIDVEDIAIKAKTGDKACLRVFKEFGKLLGSALAPSIKEFGAECLVFGGQVSKSYDLFKEPLVKKLKGLPTLKKIAVSHSLNFSAIKGAAHLVFVRKSMRKM